MYGEVNLKRDGDAKNPVREKTEARRGWENRSKISYRFGTLSHVDEHLRLKILRRRFCPQGFQRLFYFTSTGKGRSSNDAHPALLTLGRFHVISFNFDTQIAELLKCGITCWRGNVFGKHHHCFESEVFGVRGNERCDGLSIAKSNVRAGFVEED